MKLAYDALPAIYDVSVSDAGWGPTLDKVSAAAGGSGALLFGIDETDVDYTIAKASHLFADKMGVVEEFMQRFGRYDEEGRAFLFNQPALQPISDRDIWPGVDLAQREDFVFQRAGLGTFLRSGTNLSPAHGWKAGLIVHFPLHVQSLPDASRQALTFLAPHLKASLELKRFVARLAARYRMVLAALDKLLVPVCLADGRGEIVETNTAAKAFLEHRRGLTLSRSGRLVARSEDATRALDAAIVRCASTARTIGAESSASLVVPRPDDEPLCVEVSPLRDTDGELEADFCGAFVVLIDPADPPALNARTLARLCALTAAEEAVADLLLAGHAMDRIAEVRAVSPETIKTQARATYIKCAVAGRGELVRKAAQLHPPVG